MVMRLHVILQVAVGALLLLPQGESFCSSLPAGCLRQGLGSHCGGRAPVATVHQDGKRLLGGFRFPPTVGRRSGSGMLGKLSGSLNDAITQGLVTEATTLEDFEEITNSQLAVVALSATTCRKCLAVSGKFASIAKTYGKDQNGVVFASVHLDKVREVSKSTGITKTPTYLVYMDGVKVDEYVGSDPVHVVSSKIKDMVKSWTEKGSLTLSRSEDSEDGEMDNGKNVDSVIASYSPQQGGSDSVKASDSEMPTEDDMCGEDGCEIVWD